MSCPLILPNKNLILTAIIGQRYMNFLQQKIRAVRSYLTVTDTQIYSAFHFLALHALSVEALFDYCALR